MELQEQVNALTAEKNQYISMLENVNSEKIALDKMLVNSLKECLAAQKDSIIKGNSIDKLTAQVASLTKENESLKVKPSESEAI